ncbi:unnamed protein product [Polarella glacialis]|uniref:FH2 domain-containing protein n=1 Tax=Polarella glacialis TaxID=89957 RepID=A0A813I672_POLGL|nr:unnamed protein product [Polarella glacialis]CAE8645299.1 unnamed protein product [Polarella glacialis]
MWHLAASPAAAAGAANGERSVADDSGSRLTSITGSAEKNNASSTNNDNNNKNNTNTNSGSNSPASPQTNPTEATQQQALPAVNTATVEPGLPPPQMSSKGPPFGGKGKAPLGGKGGPGKGKCPPPPKAPPPGSAPKAKAKSAAAAPVKKNNTLLQLHWKVLPAATAKPQVDRQQDPLLSQLGELMKQFHGDSCGNNKNSNNDNNNSNNSNNNNSKKFLEAAEQRRRELQLPPRPSIFQPTAAFGDYKNNNNSNNTSAQKAGLQTVFADAASCDVREVIPPEMLEIYFKRQAAHTNFLAPNASRSGVDASHRSLIDDKRLQMLGILLRKYLMAHKGQSEKQAVFSLKRGVLCCDYGAVPQEGLSVIRLALRQHAVDGNKILEFVKSNGEAAIKTLDHPWHHLLVHELLKIPQIDERLECMLFQTAFQESFLKCRSDLNTFCQALMMLHEKKGVFREFFRVAHRLGQDLNRDCRAPQAARGFQLSALEKLAQTKSTRSPKHSLLHFVLAMMSSEQSSALFTSDDITILARAKLLKSFTVWQECSELVLGFHGVRDICETGKYTSSVTGSKVQIERRRRTMALTAMDRHVDNAGPAPIDTDDCFHDVIKAFVEDGLDDVQSVARGCFGAFQAYKELGVFFDDLNSVYPPPRDERDPKVDLLAVLHKFAEQVRSHRAEVEQDGLRQLLQRQQ